ncbi:MAG: TonB-dependent receptor [Paludibacteraceae bacterium]|nr:TonB-dependent receptor [Paludibacteraceae bacterium]
MSRYCCLLIFHLLSLPLIAQERLQSSATSSVSDSIDKQFTITEVVVSAKRKDEPVIPVQKLDGKRLETLSTQSVADAVRYFSGVQIKDYGGVGGLKTVDIRSMGTNHLGVFYDGIEIGNAQNGTVDLGKFSMDNIEELALYNGQKSEIFQAAKDYGSAGTLYIKTRRPKFEQGKHFNLHVTMKAGTFGLANPSILYEQRLTDNIHLSANAEYTYAHGRYHFRYRKVMPDKTVAWDTTAVRHNGDVKTWRAEVGLFGYLNDGKWHIKGYFYDSEKGIPGAIVNNVWTNSQRQWDRNAFVQANFTKTLVQGYDFQANAKYSNDYMRYLNPDTTLMYIDNHFTQQEVYLSVANRWSIFGDKSMTSIDSKGVNWDIALSADYQWNYLSSNLVNFVYPTRHTVLAAVATQLDWKYLKAQASLLATFIHDKLHRPTLLTPTSYRQKPQFTPSVSISYQPYLKEELYLRAFYKRIFRMPTFNDLYYTDMGNISLLPEYTTQYDGGVQYDKQWSRGVVRKVSAKADGYFNEVTNKIVAIPKGNGQYRWQIMNIGRVEIRGVDVNAATTLCLFGNESAASNQWLLTVAAAYTYQKAQDFSAPKEITYGGQIAYIPWHSGSATTNLQWHIKRKKTTDEPKPTLSLNYAFVYVGERYHNSANIPANHEQPWYTHDVSISYQMPLKSSNKHNITPRLHFAIEINNMLNQQYDVILNYPMPGINGKGIVKVIL